MTDQLISFFKFGRPDKKNFMSHTQPPVHRLPMPVWSPSEQTFTCADIYFSILICHGSRRENSSSKAAAEPWASDHTRVDEQMTLTPWRRLTFSLRHHEGSFNEMLDWEVLDVLVPDEWVISKVDSPPLIFYDQMSWWARQFACIVHILCQNSVTDLHSFFPLLHTHLSFPQWNKFLETTRNDFFFVFCSVLL